MKIHSSHNKTQEKLFISLCHLLRTQDISDISVRTLIKESNLSRSTFYTYYSDKFELLEELENSVIHQLEVINYHLPHFPLQSFSDTEIAPFYYETYLFIKENEDIFKALLGPYKTDTFIYKWKKHIRHYFTQVMIQNNINKTYHIFIAESIASTLISLAVLWLFELPETSPESLAKIASRITVSSMSSFLN
ncbi:TetR/AcrR family transcriptional regulator [Enterococcus casseliflavus]